MKTVLIIEDNARNLKLLKDLVEHLGHRVATASTGGVGLEQAAAAAPDLVLLDILLPDIDGVRVLAGIRALPGLAEVPIIAVSASVMPDEQARILAAGFDDFVAKPISVRPFIERVQQALGLAPQR